MVREVLDFHGLKEKYSYANLYACWSLHTKVHRLVRGYAILERINEQLVLVSPQSAAAKAAGEDELEPLRLGVVRAFGIGELRAELRELFVRFDIPAPFLDSFASWNQLFTGILSEVRGKPIQYPSRHEMKNHGPSRASHQRSLDAVIKAYGAPNVFVRSVMVDIAPSTELQGAPRLFWMCFTAGGAQIRSLLLQKYMEPREAFLTD